MEVTDAQKIIIDLEKQKRMVLKALLILRGT